MTPVRPVSVREAYGNGDPLTYAWRTHLLRLHGDLDRILKGIRVDKWPGKTFDEPQGKWREDPRPCSRCKQPTQFTTPRGRSVHPGCEGWIDRLTEDAEIDVIFMISTIIEIEDQKESLCPFDLARTLAVLVQTETPFSPEMESVSAAEPG